MLTLRSRHQAPFRTSELRRQLDWLLGSDPFFDAFSARVSAGPRFCAKRTKEGLSLRAELPGVRREDLTVRVEDGTLEVSAERTSSAPEGYRAARTERASGRFRRTFRLPEDIDAGGAEATLADGILTLSLPLRPERQPKTIDVQVS